MSVSHLMVRGSLLKPHVENHTGLSAVLVHLLHCTLGLHNGNDGMIVRVILASMVIET